MSKQVGYFSLLRSFSCFCVVIIHVFTSAAILYKDVISTSAYGISMAFSYGCFFAVPCFVMVTGALLIDPQRELSIKKILTKYVLKVLFALIVAVFIFRIFTIGMDGEGYTLSGVLVFVKQIFTAASWSHLWYIYLLIGLYLLLPAYRLVAKNADEKTLKYIVLIYFIFTSLLPLTGGVGLKSGFYIHVSTIYPLYLFLGYMIHHKIIKITKSVGVLCLLLGTCGTVALTLIRFNMGIEGLEVFLSYSSPFVVMQSLGIFSLFSNCLWEYQAGSFVKSIDGCSFWIYLYHMILVRLILRYMGFNPYEAGWVSFILLIVGIFFISFLVCFLVRRLAGK